MIKIRSNTTSPSDMKAAAWRAIYLVVGIWALSTGLAFYALMINEPQWCKFVLCWQIFLLPGTIFTKIIELKQQWNGPTDEFDQSRAAVPMLITGAISLIVFFGF